jgi:hypothetical protein
VLRRLRFPALLAILTSAALSSPAPLLASDEPANRAAAGGAVALGAWIPNSYEHPQQIDRYARLVGRQPVIVSSYPNWSGPPFRATALNAVWSRGAVPLVTWEPWDVDHRGIPLRAIADGRYDGYLRSSARQAAAWGHPILVRFAHEMNGSWYPWGRRHGNTPQLYVAAWRHVVSVFRAAGAVNVQWVWAPNVNEQAGPSISLPVVGGGPTHPFPFAHYYPGNSWVDWVGLDGFNWGKGGEWQSFTQVFANSYDTLIHLTPRPIIVAETASNERQGDKAAWVASALREEIPRFPRIRGVVWFDEAFSGVSARVDSSAAALSAFRSAASSPRYGLSREAFLATPRNLAPGPQAPPAPSDGYGAPSFLERLWSQVRRHLPWSAAAIVLAMAIVGAGLWFLASRMPRAGRARA